MEASVGKKTSEMLLMVATGLFMLVNGSEYVDVPWPQFTMWMGAVASFAGLRTWEKRTAIQAKAEVEKQVVQDWGAKSDA